MPIKRQRAMKARRGGGTTPIQAQRGVYSMNYPTAQRQPEGTQNLRTNLQSGLGRSMSSKRGGPRKQQSMPLSVTRGPSLAQLRNAARSARQTARNQLAELDRQKEIANSPRIQEAEIVRRIRYALLGDRGHLFPPVDLEQRDAYMKQITSAPTALLERASVWRLKDDDDDDDEGIDTKGQIRALQQSTIQQPNAIELHRAAVWRDVLRVLEQVTRGALDGEAAEILLKDALDDCINWGTPATCGAPSGNTLAQDLALLVKPSSRLGPSIECAHQSVSLARKALAPGHAPDAKLLEADLEHAHALAKARGTLDRGLLQLQKQQLQRLNVCGSTVSYKPASQAYIKKSNASTRAATRRAQRAANRAASPASDMENVGLSAPDDDDNDNDTTTPGDLFSPSKAADPDSGAGPSGTASEKGDSDEKEIIPEIKIAESSLSKVLGQASTKFPGDWTSLPLSELDFMDEEEQMANHERTPSYRRLPDSVPRAVCSYRSEIDAAVLNDNYVSVATTSDDANYSQLHLRRNAHEEALFKTEDEHFEIDMVVHANTSAIRALEAISRHGGQDPQWSDAQQPAWEPQFLDIDTEHIDKEVIDQEDIVPTSSERPKRSARSRAPTNENDQKVSRHRRNNSDTEIMTSDPPQQLSEEPQAEIGRGRKRAMSEDEATASSSKRGRGINTRGARSPALLADFEMNKRPLSEGTPVLHRRGLSPIQLAVICRVYGDRDIEALRALRTAPKAAAAVIAKRLREKDIEWRLARRGLDRRWRRRCRAHFAKSLDHRAHFWRALDKKRCSNKWLVEEIKDVDCDQEERGEDASPPSLRYNISCAETRRDAFMILMQALESSPCGVQERRAIARDLWRDFIALLLSLPPQWLAVHFPPSLSRLETESKLLDYLGRQQRARATDDQDGSDFVASSDIINSGSTEEAGGEDADVVMEAIDNFSSNDKEDKVFGEENVAVDDDTLLLGSQARAVGDELRLGARVLTPFGPGIVFDRKTSVEAQQDDKELTIAFYYIKYNWGKAKVRARDVFALDEADGTQYAPAELADILIDNEISGIEQSSLDKGSSSVGGKKKISPRSSSSAGKGRSMRRRGVKGDTVDSSSTEKQQDEIRVATQTSNVVSSPVAVKGTVFANEKLYVFTRLFQMIYDRLIDAKRLCKIEADRKAKANAEPHQVIDAIAADEQGEPPADSDSEDDDDYLIPRTFNANGTLTTFDSSGKANATRPASSNSQPSPLSPLFDFDEEIQRCCQNGYVGFLELVALLLCGDVNKSTFDDACRELLGNDGYSVRAIDRLARATVDVMRTLVTDDAFKALHNLPVNLADPSNTKNTSLDAIRRDIGNYIPSMAGEDLYRVSVEREAADPVTLAFEFLGTLPENEDHPETIVAQAPA